MGKQIIWVYAGLNKKPQMPINQTGPAMYVKRIFADPTEPEVQNMIKNFNETVQSEEACGYRIFDVSTEIFNDSTVIKSLEQAREIADRQMKLIPKTEVRGRR